MSSLAERIQKYDLGFTIKDLQQLTPLSPRIGELISEKYYMIPKPDSCYEFSIECGEVAIKSCLPCVIVSLYENDVTGWCFYHFLTIALEYSDIRTILICLYAEKFYSYDRCHAESLTKKQALELIAKNPHNVGNLLTDVLEEFLMICGGEMNEYQSFLLINSIKDEEYTEEYEQQYEEFMETNGNIVKRWIITKFIEYNTWSPNNHLLTSSHHEIIKTLFLIRLNNQQLIDIPNELMFEIIKNIFDPVDIYLIL